MNPFSFLNNVGSDIYQYLAPAANQVKSIFDSFPHLLGGSDTTPSPIPSPSPKPPNITVHTPFPTPTPVPSATPIDSQQVLNGFNNFAPNIPVATQSANFAQLGNQLPPTIDKLLPAILALIETGGGGHMVASNNPVNIRGIQNGKKQFINYPDFQTSLLGGPNGPDQSGGFLGLINSPTYADFRNSGNLLDFFKHYTPPGEGNPSAEELINRYNMLENLFRR